MDPFAVECRHTLARVGGERFADERYQPEPAAVREQDRRLAGVVDLDQAHRACAAPTSERAFGVGAGVEDPRSFPEGRDEPLPTIVAQESDRCDTAS
jgi:hypothetical protein